MEPTKLIYGSPKKMAEAYSVHILNIVNKTLKNHNFVNIALSGGSTPTLIFDLLAENYQDMIPWENINFFWGDERCVSPDDEESNYHSAKMHLFEKLPDKKLNIFRIKGEADVEEEILRYTSLLKNTLSQKNGYPVFHLIMLGMGDDGHTASIFPKDIDLIYSKNFVAHTTHPENGQNRITLTGRVINNAENVAFHVTGAGKASKVAGILNHEGAYQQYPTAGILPQNGKLFWFLDKEAASGL